MSSFLSFVKTEDFFCHSRTHTSSKAAISLTIDRQEKCKSRCLRFYRNQKNSMSSFFRAERAIFGGGGNIIRNACPWDGLELREHLFRLLRCRVSELRIMPMALAKIPVAIPPGEIEFTRTLSSPSSIAAHLVMWITAALATA